MLRLANDQAWIAIGTAVVLAVCLGIWGFLEKRSVVDVGSVSDSTYDSILLFFAHYPSTIEPNWQLHVARFLALIAVTAASAKAFFALLGGRVDQFRARRSRGHIVICGLGRRGSRLVEAFAAQGRRVVAIECEPRSPQIAAARERGALVVPGNATDLLVLERAGLARAECMIVVGPDDATNIEIATQAERLAPRGRALTAIVQVDDEELCRALGERAIWDEAPGGLALDFVNIYERGARALLRRHPPFGTGAGSEEPPHLLVVGLGRMGAALIGAAARLWDTLAGPTGPVLRVTVVDPRAAERMYGLTLRHPKLKKCEFVTVEIEVGSAAFEQAGFLAAPDGQATVNRVYVCLEDHVLALSAGLTLLRRLDGRPVPVVVQVPAEGESAGRFLSPSWFVRQSAGLHVVGLVEETYTPELLLDTTIETLARAQHEDYVLGLAESRGDTPPSKPYVRSWNQLEERAREENRAWAREVGPKLDAIGCELRVLDNWDQALFRFSEEEVEWLAQLEHERWMRRRLELGWRRGPRDDTARLHPDVVPWSELDEQARAVDRRSMQHLPRFLAKAGYQIGREASGQPQRM